MKYYYYYYLALYIFFFKNYLYSIKLCVRKDQSFAKEIFFQRVETENADKCLERCLDNVDICRSLVFIKNINSVCYIYNLL